MKLREQFLDYLGLIQNGETLEAIRRFYHQDVTQIENNEEPVTGFEKAIELEERNLARVISFSIEVPLWVADESQGVVMGEMDIGVVYKNQKQISFREAFVQRWKDEKIIYQRFYYSLKMP